MFCVPLPIVNRDAFGVQRIIRSLCGTRVFKIEGPPSVFVVSLMLLVLSMIFLQLSVMYLDRTGWTILLAVTRWFIGTFADGTHFFHITPLLRPVRGRSAGY